MKCPVCGKVFTPVLKPRTGRLLQDEFPDSEKWEREQLISGICSQKCWDNLFADWEDEDE